MIDNYVYIYIYHEHPLQAWANFPQQNRFFPHSGMLIIAAWVQVVFLSHEFQWKKNLIAGNSWKFIRKNLNC